jgi:hypothetical protein
MTPRTTKVPEVHNVSRQSLARAARNNLCVDASEAKLKEPTVNTTNPMSILLGR